VSEVLPERALPSVEARFHLSEAWHRRDGSFYACHLRDITDGVDPQLRGRLASRMAEVLGQPLCDRVEVTAQIMAPGDQIGVHSDRPRVGFEIARLVVQLNRGWKPGEGGVLRLHRTSESPPCREIPPRHNQGFGFLLHEDSHHSVSRVVRERRSVVFNFWHAANTPELASAVASLFTEAHFSELPSALGPIASAAESRLSEDTTLRAGFAALALIRWRATEAQILDGYRFSAGLQEADPSPLLRLADWVARLHLEAFDLDRWRQLQASCSDRPKWNREAGAIARLCLPDEP